LHECGIVHCDLKSENILLDSKQRAKITDFGMAALRNDHVTDGESSYGTWSGGTYRWMAPELFCQGSKNSKAGDVYSYGMVLWQLGSRKEPYATINSLPQLAKHIAENNNEIISLNTPQAIKKVIELCWLPEPPLKQVTDTRQRPTMKQVRRMLEKGLEEEDEKEKEKEKSIPKLEKKKAKLDKKQTEKEKKKEQKQEKKKKEKRKKNETEKKEEKEKKLTNKPSSVGTLKRWSNTKQIEHSIKKWPKGEKILKQLKTPNEILDLSNHKLTDFQLSLLIKHPTFSQFHTLVLYDNQISAEGADYLAKALSNSKIHTLDLSDNQVGVEGIRKIAFALPAHIRSIDLSGNQIGNEGVKSLAKVLANTDTCKLDLSSNQISTAGIIKLALTLPKTQIDQLSLYYNQIDSQGISKLAEILPHTKIRTLDLGKNQVSLDLQLLLKEKNPSIKFIF
jgi:serine/threonine protein kinase